MPPSLFGGDAVIRGSAGAHPRNDVLRKQIRDSYYLPIRHVADGAEYVEVVGAEPLTPFFKLADNLVGGPDGHEERLVDVVEVERAVQLVRKRRALF